MNLTKKWSDHLAENHMTYFDHMKFALFYGLCCLTAGMMLLIHAVFPCFFQTTGSDLVSELSKRFNDRS